MLYAAIGVTLVACGAAAEWYRRKIQKLEEELSRPWFPPPWTLPVVLATFFLETVPRYCVEFPGNALFLRVLSTGLRRNVNSLPPPFAPVYISIFLESHSPRQQWPSFRVLRCTYQMYITQWNPKLIVGQSVWGKLQRLCPEITLYTPKQLPRIYTVSRHQCNSCTVPRHECETKDHTA